VLPFLDRYSRQRKLPEVGAEGQRRIEGLIARVASGPGCLIELAYLERAGVGQLEMFVDWRLPGRPASGARVGAVAPATATFPHANVFRHAATRNVAAGAWRAQRALMGALQAPPADLAEPRVAAAQLTAPRVTPAQPPLSKPGTGTQ